MALVSESVETTKTDTAAVVVVDPEKIRDLRESYEQQIWDLVEPSEPRKYDGPTQSKVGQERQYLLAQYVTLASHLSKANSEDLYCSARFGLAAFEHGMFAVARKIESDVRFAASTSAALGEVMRGLLFFVAGMITLTYITAFPLVAFQNEAFASIRSIISDNARILIGTCFGFLGSIVSLLLRLPEFEVMRGRSRQFLFLTGLTLPIVGGTFAAVISALFASRVVSFSLSGKDVGSPDARLFILVGFLSGFSERFSRSLLTSMESRLTDSLGRDANTQRVAAKRTQSETTKTEKRTGSGLERAKPQPKSTDAVPEGEQTQGS